MERPRPCYRPLLQRRWDVSGWSHSAKVCGCQRLGCAPCHSCLPPSMARVQIQAPEATSRRRKGRRGREGCKRGRKERRIQHRVPTGKQAEGAVGSGLSTGSALRPGLLVPSAVQDQWGMETEALCLAASWAVEAAQRAEAKCRVHPMRRHLMASQPMEGGSTSDPGAGKRATEVNYSWAKRLISQAQHEAKIDTQPLIFPLSSFRSSFRAPSSFGGTGALGFAGGGQGAREGSSNNQGT